jgi:hypothetical protein
MSYSIELTNALPGRPLPPELPPVPFAPPDQAPNQPPQPNEPAPFEPALPDPEPSTVTSPKA